MSSFYGTLRYGSTWPCGNQFSSQAHSQTFLWGGGGGGGQFGQILGPFMITRGLSYDRVEFGHFGGGGGSDDPPDPPLATGLSSDH